ncbi:MAG: PAS domain-containing protein [Haloarculaceae archaeon]
MLAYEPGKNEREGPPVSEASGQQSLDEQLAAQLLDALGDPALVCDESGAVRATNAALEGRTSGDSVVGVAVDDLVDWVDEQDPLKRAMDRSETAAGEGRLVGDGRRYDVTCRPLERGEETVGAAATFDGEPEPDWPVYEATVNASPDNIYAFDTDYRIRAVSDRFEEGTKIPTEELAGEKIDRLYEYGVITEDALEQTRDSLAALFEGERDRVRFVSQPAIDEDALVECHMAPIRREGAVVGAVNVVRHMTERERREQALRASHERLQTLLDTLPVAMVVVDCDGTVDHAQGFDIDGVDCDREDLVGQRVEDFAGERSGLVAHYGRAIEGESGTTTTTIGDRTFEAFFEPVRRDGDVRGTIVVLVDVTDREEHERELAETNRRLDLALDTADAGVYEWYVEEDRVRWHESTVRMFGVDPDRSYDLEDAITEQIHPEDRDRVRETIETAVERGSELAVEFRMNRPDGETRWAMAEGDVIVGDDGPDRIVGTIRDVTDRKEREMELVEREQRIREVIESSADPIAMQDGDGRYRVVNRAMVDWTGHTREELRGATMADIFDGDTAERLESYRADAIETESARVVEERIPVADSSGNEDERVVQLTVAPHHGPDQRVKGTVTIARDITRLERQRDELETLTEIQELIQESIGGLTTATTREEIETTVCERLADSAYYEAAWIGSREPSSREITVDYVAGGIGDYVHGITVTAGPGEYGRGPAGQAYRTGETQVVDDLGEEPSIEPWRDDVLEHGFEGIAAVPLTYGSMTHGALIVYTDRPDSFSDREVDGFEILGETVGFALSAAQQRKLLESDRVLELEFTVRGEQSPLDPASVEHDCRFVFEDAVHAGDGRVISHLTVEDADVEVGGEVARAVDNIESVRRLDEGAPPHYEVTLERSVFQRLAEAGAQVRQIVIDGGVGTVIVEAPGDADVRRITDAVTGHYEAAELTAKRERERADAPWWRSHGDISANLTERQRNVLQTAYYSGYYEWPRDTDSETLAETLDIASTTFLQHLRKGHKHVLEAIFES